MKPFSITFVEYEEGSLVSLLLALISLTPIFAIVGHASSILMKRDLQSIVLFIGALLCVVLNEVLKHTLQQPRPTGSVLLHRLHMLEGSRKDGHGMPSNHTQLSFFFAVSLILIWQR
jgi:dolichyldiphosphatase